jgi:hypothetical protein
MSQTSIFLTESLWVDDGVVRVRRRTMPWGALAGVLCAGALIGATIASKQGRAAGLDGVFVLVIPTVIALWAIAWGRHLAGERRPASLEARRPPETSGYRAGTGGATLMVDGQRLEASAVRKVLVEVEHSPHDGGESEVPQGRYTVVICTAHPWMLDVYTARDEASAAALAQQLAAIFAVPVSAKWPRRTLTTFLGLPSSVALWGFVGCCTVLVTPEITHWVRTDTHLLPGLLYNARRVGLYAGLCAVLPIVLAYRKVADARARHRSIADA